MPFPLVADLAVFMGAVLALALYGLTASGHFPHEHRAQALRTSVGSALLWGTIGVALAALAVTLTFASQKLPISASVIGGGAMLLIAPLILQPFPDRFVDGRTGLVTFAALGLALALLARRLMF